MKLRNKKTGEIATVEGFGSTESEIQMTYTIDNNETELYLYCTSSLTTFNNEWEDYKEPEEYWYIDNAGVLQIDQVLSSEINMRKSIGNYFDTREEAELAVRKLKAWKLLKDECNIKFNGIIRDERGMLKGVKLVYDRHEVTFDRMQECINALDLLFGGGE